MALQNAQYDWTKTQEATAYDAATGQTKKKKKKTGVPETYNAQGADAARGGTMQGNTGQATNPSQYSNNVAGAMIHAPAGSLASEWGSTYGVGDVASSPGSLIDAYYGSRYGLDPLSATGQLAGQYLDPMAKAYGILGDFPSSNIDMINFGEQLLATATAGRGGQLSPQAMIQTILQGVANAGQGGTSASVFDQIATDPSVSSAINSLVGILEGALAGTMPDEALNAFLNYVSRIALAKGQDINRMSGDERARGEASGGNNIGRFLLQALGPNFGL